LVDTVSEHLIFVKWRRRQLAADFGVAVMPPFGMEYRMLDARPLARHAGATATNSNPSEEEVANLVLTHGALVERGIGSTGTGFEMPVLAAAVYARGWSYSIDRLGSDFRATVSQSSRELGQFQAIGVGWSMEAALAYALEKALSVAQRRPSVAAI
jgi:hypothetical protein